MWTGTWSWGTIMVLQGTCSSRLSLPSLSDRRCCLPNSAEVLFDSRPTEVTRLTCWQLNGVWRCKLELGRHFNALRSTFYPSEKHARTGSISASPKEQICFKKEECCLAVPRLEYQQPHCADCSYVQCQEHQLACYPVTTIQFCNYVKARQILGGVSQLWPFYCASVYQQ